MSNYERLNRRFFITSKEYFLYTVNYLSLVKLFTMAKAIKSKGAGRPKRTDKDNTTATAAERGTKPGDGRKTYIVNMALSEKINHIAWFERKKTKEVVNEAFTDRVAKFEKVQGPIKLAKK